MPKVSRCPYCNQPLTTESARKHLEREEEKLRRRLLAEARAAAKKDIERVKEATEEKVRAELEGQRSKHERALEATIERLQKDNAKLLRKVEDVNAPERGKINEEDIAGQLEHAFPDDEITLTGSKGGDILQTVRYPTDKGLETAGVILYECKDQQQWGNRFITQIKGDGRKRHTPYLLLVSRAMPAKEADVCVQDDVVITDPEHVRHLARILRQVVLETHWAALAGKDRDHKTALLYDYLRGDDFRGELATLIEAGTKLSKMLQTERRAHERDWNSRQQAYDELLHNSVAIDQSIRNIIETDGAATTTRRKPRRKSRSLPIHA